MKNDEWAAEQLGQNPGVPTTPPQPNNEKLDSLLDEIFEVDRALKWAANPKTTGYSRYWLDGYEKAYEQIKNDLPKAKAQIQQLIDEARIEELESIPGSLGNFEYIKDRLQQLRNINGKG